MKFYLNHATELESLVCWACGVPFAATSFFLSERRASGKAFTCPNGCSIRFGEPEADKLRRELVAVRAAKERAEAEARHRREEAERAGKKLDRLKRRVHAGVCAKCNRTFQNVARHMVTKHGGEP